MRLWEDELLVDLMGYFLVVVSLSGDCGVPFGSRADVIVVACVRAQ